MFGVTLNNRLHTDTIIFQQHNRSVLRFSWFTHRQETVKKKKSLGKLILHSRDFYISLMIIFASGSAHSPDVALSNRLTSLLKNVSHPVAVEPRGDVAFVVEISEAEVR